MKTYVITLSKQFPKGHGRAGESTRFRCAFLHGRDFCRNCFGGCDYDGNGESSPGRTCSRMMWQYQKLHTIRANYPLWEKRFAEIERGEACLSVRQWTGKPYRSPQVEIGRLTHADGIGIQKFEDFSPFIYDIDNMAQAPEDLEQQLAHNDGLSLADWRDCVLLPEPEHSYNVVVALCRMVSQLNERLTGRYDFAPARPLARIPSLLDCLGIPDHRLDNIIELNTKDNSK